MASWDYDPVNVPVARGGERDAVLQLRPEEGEVDAVEAQSRSEEVDAVPTWFGQTPKKTK
jgi:hypothetical protein